MSTQLPPAALANDYKNSAKEIGIKSSPRNPKHSNEQHLGPID